MRTPAAVVFFCTLLALSGLSIAAGAQTPQIADTTFTWTGTVTLANVQSANFARAGGGRLYMARRGSTNRDGLYRLDTFGRPELVAPATTPAAVLTAPNGDVFFSEDTAGVIYRVRSGTTTRELWASGFHTGDDDPAGMALVPAGYTGGVVPPGTGLVVDRGVGGPDEIWAWSSTAAMGRTYAVHTDDGTLVDAVDIVATNTAIYVADAGARAIFELRPGGALMRLTTTPALGNPVGIDFDRHNGRILVADAGTDALVAVDPATGNATTLISGLTMAADEFAAVDVSPDGYSVVVTAGGKVFGFTRCMVTAGAAGDCNGNGVNDFCDVSARTSGDCNSNWLPDECDVRATSSDCNMDLIPDECPNCAPIELVFAMDTSTSMNDEAGALCAETQSVVDSLSRRNLNVTAEILGISDNPGGAYACLQGNIITRYGTSVPGNPPANQATLGMCPGGSQVASEDWGRASSVAAGRRTWGNGTIKVVVPIADEGPWCGNPVNDPGLDRESIRWAIRTATAAGVIVSPITGTGAGAPVILLARDLAAGTGGIHHATTDSNFDIPDAILAIVQQACAQFEDCNRNHVPDDCDIASGRSRDCNLDMVPDECGAEMPDCPDAGFSPDVGPLADVGAPGDVGPNGDVGTPEDGGSADSGDLDGHAAGPDAEGGADASGGAEDGAARPDAQTSPRDANAPPGHADAAAAADTGAGTGGEGEDEGCNCRTSPASDDRGWGTSWIALVVLVTLRRRFRR